MAVSNEMSFILYIMNINYNILFYLSVIIFPLGIFSNTISILVFMRKQFAKYNIGFFNIYIAISNNILLFLSFFVYYSQSKNNDILVWSEFTCKFFNYVIRVFVVNNSWLNVLIAFDRWLCIKYPNKYKFMENRKFMYLYLVLIMLFSMICHSSNLLLNIVSTTSFNPSTNQTTTTKLCTTNEIIVNIRDGLTIIFRSILPFIVMLILNISLIRNLLNMKKKLNMTRSLSRELNFSFSIIALNILFLISILPNMVCLILLNIYQYGFKSQLTSKNLVIINLAFSASLYFLTYNFSFPFFVNLKFNKLFRKEFLLLLKNLRSKIKNCSL